LYYVHHRNENICITIGGQEKASVPLQQIHSIVFFGKNTLSTSLLGFCAKHDITITFLSENGYFEGRVCGPVSGNVLLRKRQYQRTDDEMFSCQFVRDLLYCKIRNSKTVLLRYARNSHDQQAADDLTQGAEILSGMAEQLSACEDLDSMRGVEGAAANAYFSRFDQMLSSPNGFRFETRSRRPPRNEVNAVLSFLYTVLAHDTSAALETVGLDPAAGYLHTLRPGRASLALDFMEELRAPLCDQMTLTLFNKSQLSAKDFEVSSQAVYLNDRGRRTVLNQWRARKQEEIQHPFLKEKIPIGLIPYTQAMLFARVLRGDLDRYPPFMWR
jgi:CRISPR-associated protein Cas1